MIIYPSRFPRNSGYLYIWISSKSWGNVSSLLVIAIVNHEHIWLYWALWVETMNLLWQKSPIYRSKGLAHVIPHCVIWFFVFNKLEIYIWVVLLRFVLKCEHLFYLSFYCAKLGVSSKTARKTNRINHYCYTITSSGYGLQRILFGYLRWIKINKTCEFIYICVFKIVQWFWSAFLRFTEHPLFLVEINSYIKICVFINIISLYRTYSDIVCTQLSLIRLN